MDPHRRPDQEAVAVRDGTDVRGPRPRRPADGTVPGPRPAARRNEARTAGPPVRAAHDPVPQPPSRSPPPPLRMAPLHHRPAGAAVRLRQRQAGLLRGQGKDPHPGDRRRPSVVGQPTLPTARPAGEARTRDAATEASVPEPPDRGGGNLSGTDIHGPRFAWIRSLVRYVLVTGPGPGPRRGGRCRRLPFRRGCRPPRAGRSIGPPGRPPPCPPPSAGHAGPARGRGRRGASGSGGRAPPTRASADRPVHRSRAAGDHVAEPKPTAPETPCAQGVSGGAPGRRAVAPVPADGAAPPSPPSARRYRHPPRGRA